MTAASIAPMVLCPVLLFRKIKNVAEYIDKRCFYLAEYLLTNPLVEGVMNAPDQMLLNISPVFEYKLEPKKDIFDGFVCEGCGEMTVMEYGRIKGDKKVCMDCAVKN